ncbi:MAG: hypothetical protein COB51_09945 [Moraxellaceae bacterium]|nr:MAG: hypothetical protein COB51_09945 [Moraxellaceae bacterium]
MKNLMIKSMLLKLLVVLSASIFLPAVSGADIAMVVHKDSSLSSVEMKDVKLLYLGKRKKIAGIKVIPIALPDDHATTKKFVNGVLSKTLKQHRGYWARLVFTGKGSPPVKVRTSAELKKWVSQNTDGIGFIDAKDIDDSVKVTATFK